MRTTRSSLESQSRYSRSILSHAGRRQRWLAGQLKGFFEERNRRGNDAAASVKRQGEDSASGRAKGICNDDEIDPFILRQLEIEIRNREQIAGGTNNIAWENGWVVRKGISDGTIGLNKKPLIAHR